MVTTDKQNYCTSHYTHWSRQMKIKSIWRVKLTKAIYILRWINSNAIRNLSYNTNSCLRISNKGGMIKMSQHLILLFNPLFNLPLFHLIVSIQKKSFWFIWDSSSTCRQRWWKVTSKSFVEHIHQCRQY